MNKILITKVTSVQAYPVPLYYQRCSFCE